jgi:hypothetical protein
MLQNPTQEFHPAAGQNTATPSGSARNAKLTLRREEIGYARMANPNAPTRGSVLGRPDRTWARCAVATMPGNRRLMRLGPIDLYEPIPAWADARNYGLSATGPQFCAKVAYTARAFWGQEARTPLQRSRAAASTQGVPWCVTRTTCEIDAAPTISEVSCH